MHIHFNIWQGVLKDGYFCFLQKQSNSDSDGIDGLYLLLLVLDVAPAVQLYQPLSSFSGVTGVVSSVSFSITVLSAQLVLSINTHHNQKEKVI